MTTNDTVKKTNDRINNTHCFILFQTIVIITLFIFIGVSSNNRNSDLDSSINDIRFNLSIVRYDNNSINDAVSGQGKRLFDLADKVGYKASDSNFDPVYWVKK